MQLANSSILSFNMQRCSQKKFPADFRKGTPNSYILSNYVKASEAEALKMLCQLLSLPIIIILHFLHFQLSLVNTRKNQNLHQKRKLSCNAQALNIFKKAVLLLMLLSLVLSGGCGAITGHTVAINGGCGIADWGSLTGRICH